MTKLDDTQLVLLSVAASRDKASLYPLPDTLTAARTTKALTSLAKAGLDEERETSEAALVHRTDGELRDGLFITQAGPAAAGIKAAPPSAPVEPAPAVVPR